MDYTIEQFKKEVNSIFNLDFLKLGRKPIDLGKYMFESFSNLRVNHYLIKSNDSEIYNFGEIDEKDIGDFVNFAKSKCSEMGIDLTNRYCFLTLDQGWVEPGTTLRADGWHIDGMQGDEIEVKKLADIELIWSDCLPTSFTSQAFDITDMNPSVHNIFNWLGKQIDESQIVIPDPFHLYAINSYHVHAATKAIEKTYRRFIRLAYTQTPVTSVKMTVNPQMSYNYSHHVTSGEIPAYLK
ncbi:MAG: hypothetical protein JWL80_219 [Parcubacteria group bacterium]|nr:hypothetical protein [Parcubacteria group bacterium]